MKTIIYQANINDGLITVQNTDGIYYAYLGSVLVYSNTDKRKVINWVRNKEANT